MWSTHLKKKFNKLKKKLLMINTTIKWSTNHINYNKTFYIIYIILLCFTKYMQPWYLMAMITKHGWIKIEV